MICHRKDDINVLIPYINKPVYIRGYCWTKHFDGWTVIYERKDGANAYSNLAFDYRGRSYPAAGFLPQFALPTSSTYNNAFIKRNRRMVEKE